MTEKILKHLLEARKLLADVQDVKENRHAMGFLDEAIKWQRTLLVEKDFNLLDYFDTDLEFVFKSKRRRLGASTGDDAHLFIENNELFSSIYWQTNRGEQTTIFEGRVLVEKDFEKVFELLGIRESGIFRK